MYPERGFALGPCCSVLPLPSTFLSLRSLNTDESLGARALSTLSLSLSLRLTGRRTRVLPFICVAEPRTLQRIVKRP